VGYEGSLEIKHNDQAIRTVLKEPGEFIDDATESGSPEVAPVKEAGVRLRIDERYGPIIGPELIATFGTVKKADIDVAPRRS